MPTFNKTEITEFINRLSKLTGIKSRKGIEYEILSINTRIKGRRLSTLNNFYISIDKIHHAYNKESLNSLPALTNNKIKRKYEIEGRAQSPTWAILNALYRNEQKNFIL